MDAIPKPQDELTMQIGHVWWQGDGRYRRRVARQRRARRILLALVVVITVTSMAGGPGSEVLALVMPTQIPAPSNADLAALNSAGPVSIGANDSGLAMFDQPLMAPGQTVENCVVVTYSGSQLPSDVSLYESVSGTGLDAYLNMTIEVGTGGRFGDCTGFISTGTGFSGTLAEFGAAHTNFANGLRVWSPTTTPESRTYRFALTLQDDNKAQGKSLSVSFTWEAQNH